MKNILILVSLFVTTAAFSQNKVIPLYSSKVPNSKPNSVQEKTETDAKGIVRISQVTAPAITVYPAANEKATGAAVLIIPGGGYGIIAIDHEGYQVAKRFNEMGVTAFVLKYRLPNDQTQVDKSIAPLQDAQQALRLIRKQAKEYGVNPARVGVIGFSAGGHLASTAGTHFAKPVGERADGTDVRPDFMVLVYPVISFSDSLMHGGSRKNLLGPNPDVKQVALYSNELQVTAQTPPTLLVHNGDDQAVKVQNSIAFYLACLRNGVPAEMHIYPKGGHGYGMNNSTTQDKWMDRVQNWMATNGWLKQ